MRVVLLNGEVKNPEEAHVSIFDRGLLHGDSVFETLRTYGGRPHALGEHVARLARSAALVFLDLPIGQDALAEEVVRAVALAGPGDWYVRVLVTRGPGPLGIDTDLAGPPTRAVLVGDLHAPPIAAYRDGVSAVLVRGGEHGLLAGAKVGSFLENVIASRAARRAGAGEALWVNGRGEVTEGATSNLLFVEQGMLVTPPVSAGILAGITREHVLASARALGVAVREETPDVARLVAADEAMVTSSLREVVPVVSIDGHTVGDGHPGPLTRRLHAALRSAAGAAGALPWEE